jgi:hypothetical protein
MQLARVLHLARLDYRRQKYLGTANLGDGLNWPLGIASAPHLLHSISQSHNLQHAAEDTIIERRQAGTDLPQGPGLPILPVRCIPEGP